LWTFPLALLARLNSQLQLITLAFPIKMLVSLGLLAWLLLVFPRFSPRRPVPFCIWFASFCWS
jgi:flagellar biosynthesis protein FliR